MSALNALYRSIFDPALEQRDLLVDELGDLIRNEEPASDEQLHMAMELLSLIVPGCDQWLSESILYLVVDIFDKGIGRALIAPKVATLIAELPVSSLYFAIMIVSESDLPNRRELLAPLLDFPHAGIQDALVEASAHLPGLLDATDKSPQ